VRLMPADSFGPSHDVLSYDHSLTHSPEQSPEAGAEGQTGGLANPSRTERWGPGVLNFKGEDAG